jgi:hypothetical protein
LNLPAPGKIGAVMFNVASRSCSIVLAGGFNNGRFAKGTLVSIYRLGIQSVPITDPTTEKVL